MPRKENRSLGYERKLLNFGLDSNELGIVIQGRYREKWKNKLLVPTIREVNNQLVT